MADYGAIVDGRLMGALGSHFGDVCTVQRLTEAVDSDGQVVEAWADLYVAVPCSLMPTKGREIRGANQTYVVANYSIALRGAYPDIKESDRAIVAGTAYDILLVSTTLGMMTTLACEVVR